MPIAIYYAATLEIAGCIDENGTLKVFSRKGGEGSGEGFLQVIEAENWDGEEVSDDVSDNVVCKNLIAQKGDGTFFSNTNGDASLATVSLTVTKFGENEDGSIILDVEWKLTGCENTASGIEGAQMVTIEVGGACPA